MPGQILTVGAETGLEFTNNSINLNGETDIAEWQNTSGEWFGWRKGTYRALRMVYDQLGHKDELVPACAEANGYNAPGDFSFASLVPPGKNYNTECYGHEETEPFVLAGTPTLTGPAIDPTVAYHDPVESAPTLSDAQVAADVTSYVAHAGDAQPTSIQAVNVSRAQAYAALNGVYPASSSLPAVTD